MFWGRRVRLGIIFFIGIVNWLGYCKVCLYWINRDYFNLDSMMVNFLTFNNNLMEMFLWKKIVCYNLLEILFLDKRYFIIDSDFKYLCDFLYKYFKIIKDIGIFVVVVCMIFKESDMN